MDRVESEPPLVGRRVLMDYNAANTSGAKRLNQPVYPHTICKHITMVYIRYLEFSFIKSSTINPKLTNG